VLFGLLYCWNLLSSFQSASEAHLNKVLAERELAASSKDDRTLAFQTALRQCQADNVELSSDQRGLRYFLTQALNLCGWWCDGIKTEMGEHYGWWYQEISKDNEPSILFLRSTE